MVWVGRPQKPTTKAANKGRRQRLPTTQMATTTTELITRAKQQVNITDHKSEEARSHRTQGRKKQVDIDGVEVMSRKWDEAIRRELR